MVVSRAAEAGAAAEEASEDHEAGVPEEVRGVAEVASLEVVAEVVAEGSSKGSFINRPLIARPGAGYASSSCTMRPRPRINLKRD